MCVFLPVRKSQGKTPIWNSANVPGVWTYESSEWVTQTPKPNPQNLLSFHYLNTKDVVKRGSKVRQRTRHTIKQTGVTIVTNPPCRDDRWTSVGCYLHTCIMLLLPTDTTAVIMSRLQQQINTDNMQGGTIRQTCMWDTVNLFWCKLRSHEFTYPQKCPSLTGPAPVRHHRRPSLLSTPLFILPLYMYHQTWQTFHLFCLVKCCYICPSHPLPLF